MRSTIGRDGAQRDVHFIRTAILCSTVLTLGLLAGCGSAANTGSGTPNSQSAVSQPAAEAIPQTKENPSLTSGEFFLKELKPVLEKECSTCHHSQQQQAPLTIFSRTAMEKKLDAKKTPETTLFKKVSGEVSHGGGNRCLNESKACDQIIEWHALVKSENPQTQTESQSDESDANGGLGNTDTSGEEEGGTTNKLTSGAVTSITKRGQIFGYALNPNSPADIVEYAIYIGGSQGTGTQLVRGRAELTGFDEGAPGNHRFEYQLPDSYLDGTRKELYIYALVGEEATLLNSDKTQFYGYKPTSAGKAFYDAEVRPLLLTSCQGSCHIGSMNYETNYNWFLSPAKHEGATARNNRHINNPATANGEGHGGGRRCASIDDGLCAKLQEWWTLEFSSL